MREKQRGGKRDGAGAPKKDEVRKVICYRLNAIEKEKTDIFVNNLKKVIHISK